MADLDLESPGAAFARQARTEARVTVLLTRALDAFLGDVRRAIESDGFAMSAGAIVERWRVRVAESLDSRHIDVEAAAYIAEVVGESQLPDDAYALAVALLTLAHEEQWPARDLRDTARVIFSAEGGVDSLTAAARRPRNGANWAALDEAAGGNFMDKMKRDARTAVTGLDGLLVSAELARQGYTRRRWVTKKDPKVRDTHRHAEGQTVDVGEPFIVGGYPLRYPGDRQAPPALSINCRCVQVGVRWRRTGAFPQAR